MRMKKVASMLAAAAMAMSLLSGTAMAGETEAAAAVETPAPSDETLTVAIQAEPNSIVPDVVFLSNYISSITRLMYEPLIIQDFRTLEFEPTGLTTAVEQVDDTHLHITLREGVKFQNGEDFTTDDVMYMFQQAAQGPHAGDYYAAWDVDNFKVDDDYNMTLATKYPWGQAQSLLGFNTCLVIEHGALEAAGGAGITAQYLENAGTGKYKFAEWVPGEYILLTRNDDYWDQDHLGYFKEIKFVFVTDTSARAMTVQSGGADIALDCDPANYTVYDADPSIKAYLEDLGNTQMLVLNSGEGRALADPKVREAVCKLVDRAALQAVANSGLGTLATTSISPLCPMWDGVEADPEDPVDIEGAKELLAEAGYADGLTLQFRAAGQVTTMASMIQEQLRQGGIDMQIEVAEMPVHFGALREGDYDMFCTSQQCGYYSEAARFMDGRDYTYADLYGGTGYQDEAFCDLVQKCVSTIDMDERKAAYAELQQSFRDNYVSKALYTGVKLSVTTPRVEGIGLYGVGIVDLSNCYNAAE